MNARSEKEERPDFLWRRFALGFLIVAFSPIIFLMIAVLVLDPFDAGRFPSLSRAGTSDDRGHTYGISRGRDPRFNAVIVGNSRSVMLDPKMLSQSTGLKFAQMSVPGAGPLEEMAALHWFVANRKQTNVIVVGVDQRWCMNDMKKAGLGGFPFPLYGESDWGALFSTINTSTLVYLKERVQYDLGLISQIDPEGFYDLQTRVSWAWHPSKADEQSWLSSNEFDGSLPAIDALSRNLSQINPKPFLLLWMPPLFSKALPTDRLRSAALQTCKAAFRDVVDKYGNGAFLDDATPNTFNNNPTHFLDATHLNREAMLRVAVRVSAAIQLRRPFNRN